MYASYILKHFPYFLEIAKPRLQKNPPDKKEKKKKEKNPPDHLFLRWHHQPITCALPFIVNCYMHLLPIASHFSTIPPNLSNANSDCSVRNVPAMPTKSKRVLWQPVMQLWASACGDWHWMARHISLSFVIGWWWKDDQEDFFGGGA